MELEQIYTEIDNVRTKTVLVEGRNDKRALEKLGFTNIVPLSGPLYQMVEKVEDEDEVLILTDLDSHGRRLYRYFYNELTKRGVRINNRLRQMLFGTHIRQIEGLDNYLRRLEMMA